MDKKNQHIDFELIARYLSLEASEDENSRFEHWLDAKSANREVFQEYKILWDQVGKVESIAGLDLDAEWESLVAKIDDMDAPTVISMKKRSALLVSRIAVAAILVLALSFGGIFISRRTGYHAFLTENNTETIILPDVSKVTLNAYSNVQYKKHFRKDLRKISLEGEAFFEVEKDASRPFVILVDGVEVKVLGTSFNVKAYKDNSEIEVIVSTGQVALTRPGETPESIILKPGNKGIFSRSDQSLTISRDIDRNYLAWKTRSLVFEDQSLIEVVQILNRVYNSRITVTSDSLKNARITSSFNNQTLDAILNVLAATLDFDVEKSNGQILINEGI